MYKKYMYYININIFFFFLLYKKKCIYGLFNKYILIYMFISMCYLKANFIFMIYLMKGVLFIVSLIMNIYYYIYQCFIMNCYEIIIFNNILL